MYASYAVLPRSLKTRIGSRCLCKRSPRRRARVKDPRSIAIGAYAQSFAHSFSGRTRSGSRLIEEMYFVHGKWLDPLDYFNAISDYGWNMSLRGYAEKTCQWIERGRALAKDSDSKLIRGNIFVTLGFHALALLGRYAESAEQIRVYRKVAEETPNEIYRWSLMLSGRSLSSLRAR